MLPWPPESWAWEAVTGAGGSWRGAWQCSLPALWACGWEQAGAGHLASTWQRLPGALWSVAALEARGCAAADVFQQEKGPQ